MKITLLSSVHVLGYRSLIIYLHGRYAVFSMETMKMYYFVNSMPSI